MAPPTAPSARKQSTEPVIKKKKPVKDEPAEGKKDIRSFFGEGAAQSHAAASSSKAKKSAPIEIDSSEEDVKPVKKPVASSSKKSHAIDLDADPDEDIKPRVKAEAVDPPSKKRKASVVAGAESDEDIKPAAAKKRLSSAGAGANGSSKAGAAAKKAAPAKKAKKEESDDEDDYDVGQPDESSSDEDYEEEEEPRPAKAKKAPAKSPAKKAPAKAPAKAKSPAKPKAAPKSKAEAKPKAAKKEATDDKPKFDFAAAAARRAAGPSNPGSKVIPEGQPNCLAGLTLVFTGELSSLGRDEVIELAKRYGATVTGAPSGRTSYVVLGENAGPSKLKKIKDNNIPTINEDEFLDLIGNRPGGGELNEKQKEKEEKERKAIEKQAKEIEIRQKEEDALKKRKANVLSREGVATKKTYDSSSQLWTTKYAPAKLTEICGNKGQVEKLGQWLEAWPTYAKSGFRKGGPAGMGLFRAVLISGGPGIGKTTSAHLMATLKGYNPIELNASDARSKKLVENATNIDNSSLDGWFSGGNMMDSAAAGIHVGKRSCLIMDEVDGMSGGDRGGVGALNVLIRKTKIPIILICNDAKSPKMKPLQATTFALQFRKPTVAEVRSRIMTVLFREGMKVDKNVVDNLIESTNSDIRQVLNMLSTWRLSKKEMSFDEGKQLAAMSEKYSIQTPFNIIPQLIGPYSWSRTSKSTLNDKLEMYFQDFSFVPLFLQENYIKNEPARSGGAHATDPDNVMKRLDLFSKAADSISDGDLLDGMIHSSEQHWSLLPAHGFASTIRPASFIYGGSTAQGSYSPISFPMYLGQNSKRTKLDRLLGDIQIKMRLKVSGSRKEIRQEYMPIMAYKLVLPLTKSDAVDRLDTEIIPCLDEYFLNKEDWDAFVELGVGSMAEADVLKKVSSATKSAFTRLYNKTDHPVAFHKADMFAASKKMTAEKAPAADLEDVAEEDDEPVVDDAKAGEGEDDEDDTNDLSKDKLIKVAGGKGKSKAKPKAPAKPRAKKSE